MSQLNNPIDIFEFELIDVLERADECRKKGNDLFNANKYFEALAQYNKALTITRGDDKELSALCYANRSAVYLEMKYFQHCLNNITLAEPHYPADKMQKLHDRRQKCLKLMRTNPDRAMQTFITDIQLSYEPNSRSPMFIKDLEMKEDSTYGKHLVATRDLKAGDVVAICKPWVTPTYDFTADYLHGCYTCLNTNNGDLIHGNCRALFCSEKCRDEHETNEPDHIFIHELEKLYGNEPNGVAHSKWTTDVLVMYRIFMKMINIFDNIDDMRNFVKSHEPLNYHFCDFDWSLSEDEPAYQKNILLVIMSKTLHIKKISKKYLENVSQDFRSQLDNLKVYGVSGRAYDILNDGASINQQFLDKFIQQIFVYAAAKSLHFMLVAYEDLPLGVLSAPTMDILNISCDPNVNLRYESYKKIVWTVVQPIKAGSQLFMASDEFQYYDQYNVKCAEKGFPVCHACSNNWQNSFDSKQMRKDVRKDLLKYCSGRNDPKNVQSLLKFKQEICNYINQHFVDYYTNPKTRQTIAAKSYILKKIIESIGHPFPPKSPILEFLLEESCQEVRNNRRRQNM